MSLPYSPVIGRQDAHDDRSPGGGQPDHPPFPGNGPRSPRGGHRFVLRRHGIEAEWLLEELRRAANDRPA